MKNNVTVSEFLSRASNSSGSSIAFPPLLTPSPPFSGYNSTGGDGGGRLRTPDMVSAFDDLIRFASALDYTQFFL